MDTGQPVADDRNTSLEVVVFSSGSEDRRLAGYLYGANTDAGGQYLEGDPSAYGNQARFVTYRDDIASTCTPTLWWIEGLAEYVSYGLRPARTWSRPSEPATTPTSGGDC
ncbi:hypothetical protein GCM10023235_71090 [Kitasatospora terrestris]|uniref:Uncharacterized protein n=1 Tax=Kitasatospora terrestris TaxID=258051 RepID=A0ABP9ETD5_9ACTN